MSAAISAIILVMAIVLLSSEAAGAQSANDYSKSCSRCGLAEITSLIREEFDDVKTLIAANQFSSVEASKQALASALVREYNLC